METMLGHLRSRFFDPARYSGITVTDQIMTVMLWNLSGECVGWQSYNPSRPKVEVGDPLLQKYYSQVTKPFNGNHSKLAVWGLETVCWTDSVLFITEGIFDAARLHWYNLPAVAVLGSAPVNLTGWLMAMPQCKVACVQGDNAGAKLAAYGDECVFMPENHDVSSLSEEQFVGHFNQWL